METERLIPKQFTVKFLDKCEWQKGFKLDINMAGLVCMEGGPRTVKVLVLECICGSQERARASALGCAPECSG
jgi:hypothetical protein